MSNKSNPRIAVQPFVLALAEVDQGLLPLVGGKGANLGEMMRIGLPVPPGFCVTTMAYARVAAEAQIDLLIGEMEQTPSNSTERLAALASQMRSPVTGAVGERKGGCGPVPGNGNGRSDDNAAPPFKVYIWPLGSRAATDHRRR